MQTLYNTAVFLKQDSAKGCQVFRETKMRNGERVILAVLNLCVRNEIHTNYSVIDNTQAVKSVSRARHWHSQCQAKRSGYAFIWGQPLIFFLHVTCIKDKQMLVFNFIFELLWVGRDSSASSVAFLGVPWAKIDWVPMFMNLEFRDFNLSYLTF